MRIKIGHMGLGASGGIRSRGILRMLARPAGWRSARAGFLTAWMLSCSMTPCPDDVLLSLGVLRAIIFLGISQKVPITLQRCPCYFTH